MSRLQNRYLTPLAFIINLVGEYLTLAYHSGFDLCQRTPKLHGA